MRQLGFEPSLLAWKAKVIPDYTTGAMLNKCNNNHKGIYCIIIV